MNKKKQIVFVNQSSGYLMIDIVNEFKDDAEYHYSDMTPIDVKTIKDSIVAENLEGLIYIPKIADNKELQSNIQYISNESPGMAFVNQIESTIAAKITKSNLKNANLDAQAIEAANAKAFLVLMTKWSLLMTI